jgi:hypothetical protein
MHRKVVPSSILLVLLFGVELFAQSISGVVVGVT